MVWKKMRTPLCWPALLHPMCPAGTLPHSYIHFSIVIFTFSRADWIFFFFRNIPHGKLAIWLKLSVSHQSVSLSTILWNLHWDGVSLAPSPRSLTPLDIASFTVKCSYCNSEWNRGFHNETPEFPFQGKSQDFIWCTTIFSLVSFQ